jgi:hypothetical protein
MFLKKKIEKHNLKQSLCLRNEPQLRIKLSQGALLSHNRVKSTCKNNLKASPFLYIIV